MGISASLFAMALYYQLLTKPFALQLMHHYFLIHINWIIATMPSWITKKRTHWIIQHINTLAIPPCYNLSLLSKKQKSIIATKSDWHCVRVEALYAGMSSNYIMIVWKISLVPLHTLMSNWPHTILVKFCWPTPKRQVEWEPALIVFKALQGGLWHMEGKGSGGN